MFKAFLFNAFIMSSVLFSLKASDFSREHLYTTYLLILLLIVFWRYLAVLIIKIYRKSGYNYRRIIIIGGGDVAKQLYNYFHFDSFLGVKLLGIFCDNKITFKVAENNLVFKDTSLLSEFLTKNDVDEIFYTNPLIYTNKIKELVKLCDKHMVRFKLVPDFRAFIFKRVNIDFFEDVPVITLREEPLTDFINRVVKRIFDIIFSFLVIILILAWLYPIIAI